MQLNQEINFYGSMFFCLGTEVRTLIVFITNDTALRMLEHISQIGNSQCLFKFKDMMRLVYTHY